VWFNIWKSINIIEHVNRNEDKNHIIISINAEKAFDKIEHASMIKAMKKLRIAVSNLNTIRLCTANQQYYSEWKKNESMFFQIRNETRMSPTFLSNLMLEFFFSLYRYDGWKHTYTAS
jgi:hypothetical protein